VGSPFKLGNSATVTIPEGASRLQMGINDDVFADNSGALTITVTQQQPRPAQTVSRADAFTVQPRTISFSISPASATQGQSLTVNITGAGTHFAQGTTTANFGTGITVGTLNVTGPGSASANITIAQTATTGIRAVTITTGSEVIVLPAAFEVLPAVATITSVNPATGMQGATLDVVTITGANTHFGTGTTVDFGANVTVQNLQVVNATVPELCESRQARRSLSW
jgi:hypothetical protein